MKKSIIIKTLLFLPFLLSLNGCGGSSSLSTRSNTDLEMLANANKGQIINSIDPKGNGTIDPKIVTEQGKTTIFFNQGDSNLSLKIKFGTSSLATKSFTVKQESETLNQESQELPESSDLKDFSYVDYSVTVDDRTVQVKAHADKLASDLSYTLAFMELAQNSKIKITTTAYDKSEKVLGQSIYEKVITSKDNTEELNIKLNNI